MSSTSFWSPESISFIISHLKRNCKRWFLITTIFCFAFPLIWMQNLNDRGKYGSNYSSREDIVQEVIRNVGKNLRYAELYRLPSKLPAGIKYILLWTPADYYPFHIYGSGQWAFVENNCSMINCYVTSNRSFLGGDYTKFDALIFNGRNILNVDRNYLPKERKPNQIYIFANMESSDNYPICQPFFDEFFNLTATYKLDSDILTNYIRIKTKDGKIVGPSKNYMWKEDLGDIKKEMRDNLKNKSKAVAWFVSHCESRNKRFVYAENLKNALSALNLELDIYGQCGNLVCARERQEECDRLLQSDYYFYLSFENSFSEDYVTEKLLHALNNYAVPIVFGGADYTKFLPPGSYIDATMFSPSVLAKLISSVIENPELYYTFFTWRNYYTYDVPSDSRICALCSILNNMTYKKTYKSFRSWWNQDYKKRCD